MSAIIFPGWTDERHIEPPLTTDALRELARVLDRDGGALCADYRSRVIRRFLEPVARAAGGPVVMRCNLELRCEKTIAVRHISTALNTPTLILKKTSALLGRLSFRQHLTVEIEQAPGLRVEPTTICSYADEIDRVLLTPPAGGWDLARRLCEESSTLAPDTADYDWLNVIVNTFHLLALLVVLLGYPSAPVLEIENGALRPIVGRIGPLPPIDGNATDELRFRLHSPSGQDYRDLTVREPSGRIDEASRRVVNQHLCIWVNSLTKKAHSNQKKQVDKKITMDSGLRVSECAELLLMDVSRISREQAMARVSWAAGEGKFRTNGKKGIARRIDRDSFSTWRLEQRERDLDAENEGPA